MLIGLLCLLLIASGQSTAAALSTDLSLPTPDRPAAAVEATAPQADANQAARQRAREALAQLPHYFIANAGQLDAQVAFYARSRGHTIYFTPAEVVLALPQNVLRLQFLGANRQVTLQGSELTPAQVSYFIGNDPARWRTGIPTYHEVVYHDLYPGIDAHFAGQQQGELKYTFVVQPGAAVARIRLAYAGATGLHLDTNGDLIVETGAGSDSLKDSRPYVYQDVDGQRIEVEAAFALRADRSYGFTITGDYDRSYPLVIDPGLLYSTYLGGSNQNDSGGGIAVGAAGCAYVTGFTSSADFPTTLMNAYDPSLSGTYDAFVAKIDTTESGAASLLYCTYLGGSTNEYGQGIDVDGSGYVYVTGNTSSNDFPTLNAYDNTHNGDYDVFVAKFDMTQSGAASLLYSTYLGGTDIDYGYGISTAGTGYAFVTGKTYSTDFPTLNAYDPTFNGGTYDGFVTKLDTTQSGSSSLLYSTYLGGTNYDYGAGIMAGTSSIVYMTGHTQSTDFPTTANAYDTGHNGYVDVVVTKINTTLSGTSSLLYSTYLGGIGYDEGHGIVMGRGGSAYVTGTTASTDFPTKNAYDSSQNGSYDAFVARLDMTQSGTASLVYSTYLGGAGYDDGNGIAGVNYLYVTGRTGSANFPTLGAYDSTFNGGSYDAFVAKLSWTATGTSSLLYSTFLGGSSDDIGYGIAADTGDCAYVTGYTVSTNFPLRNAYDSTYNGGYNDVFVTKLGPSSYLPSVLKAY